MADLDALLDTLADRVAVRVLAELRASEPEAAGNGRPRLLDRRGLASMLGCCVDVVDRLRSEGLPELHVGDSPRFEPDAVLAWLREREATRSASGETDGGSSGNAAGFGKGTASLSIDISASDGASEEIRGVTLRRPQRTGRPLRRPRTRDPAA
jgi:hypothetical protein